MLLTKHSVKTTAKPQAVWSLWQNAKEWCKWDHGIESSGLNGDFTTGSRGWLKPKSGPKVKFEILEIIPLKKFHDRSFLPLTKLDFIHTIKVENGFTIVTHEVRMTGLLTFLFSRIVGATIKKDLPRAMENLVKIAEELK
jgi:hypothetical protein